MTDTHSFPLDNSWRFIFEGLGIQSANVLRRANLPDNLLSQEGVKLSMHEYFRLWQSLDDEASDPLLPLKLGRMFSVEHFSPPIFAALCSRDLNLALGRISRFKRLICPIILLIDEQPDSTSITLKFLDPSAEPPPLLVAAELIFFVQIARLATKEEIYPLEVLSTYALSPRDAFTDFFWCGGYARSK